LSTTLLPGRQVQEVAFVADAAIEHDVELGVAERRGDLVLDDPGAGAVADGDFVFLDGTGPADVDADAGIELQRRPPGVVSGLPNITPIFSRIWLMKMTVQRLLEMAPVSFRRAWLMSRACRPTWLSPISPSISARGMRAATESMTMTSTALERTSSSQISRACSPVSGWETSRSSSLTPRRLAQDGVEGVLGVDERGHAAGFLGVGDDVESEGCLPLDSGPKTSRTRPRGTPLPPRAMSRLREPVGMPSMLAFVAVEFHDGAFTELLFDLLDGAVEGGIAGWVMGLGGLGFGDSLADSLEGSLGESLESFTSRMTGSRVGVSREGFGD
jgi:hypothetical protein